MWWSIFHQFICFLNNFTWTEKWYYSEYVKKNVVWSYFWVQNTASSALLNKQFMWLQWHNICIKDNYVYNIYLLRTVNTDLKWYKNMHLQSLNSLKSFDKQNNII